MTDANLLQQTLARIESPDWLAASRRLGLDQFLSAGLPGRDQEAWRYTPLDQIEHSDLHVPANDTPGKTCPDLSAYPGHVLAFQNGGLVCHGTYLVNQLASSLRDMAGTQAVEGYLGRLAGDTALVKLNQALWQDGTRIFIPKELRVSLPIFVVHATDETDAMLHPRNLAVLEEGSEAVLVEHFAGHTEDPYWQNVVTEITLGRGAKLTHIRVIEEGAAATHTGLTAVHQAADSEYRCLHIGLAGQVCRHDLVVQLQGAGARLAVDVLDMAAGARRQTDLHLRVDHLAPATRSRLEFCGMAGGRGRSVFDGRVVVHRDAAGTDAGQSCRGLILSPHAEVDARPQLEIYTDAVQCSHGVAIGSLDAEALFYLRSRGIDAAVARAMLLEAFAAVPLGLLTEANLGDWLLPGILARLAGPEWREQG